MNTINKPYKTQYAPKQYWEQCFNYKVSFVNKPTGAGLTHFTMFNYNDKARLIIEPDKMAVKGKQQEYNNFKGDKPNIVFCYEGSGANFIDVYNTLNNNGAAVITLAFFLKLTRYDFKYFFSLIHKPLFILFDEIHQVIAHRTFTKQRDFLSRIRKHLNSNHICFATATPIGKVTQSGLFHLYKKFNPIYYNLYKENAVKPPVKYYNTYKEGQLTGKIEELMNNGLVPVVRCPSGEVILSIIKTLKENNIQIKADFIVGEDMTRKLRLNLDLSTILDTESPNIVFCTNAGDAGWSSQNPNHRMIFIRGRHTTQRDVIQFFSRVRNSTDTRYFFEEFGDIKNYKKNYENPFKIWLYRDIIKDTFAELRDIKVHNDPKSALRDKNVPEEVIFNALQGYNYDINKESDTLADQIKSKEVVFYELVPNLQKEFNFTNAQNTEGYKLLSNKVSSFKKCDFFIENTKNNFVEMRKLDNYYFSPVSAYISDIIDVQMNKKDLKNSIEGVITMAIGEKPTESQINGYKEILTDPELLGYEEFADYAMSNRKNLFNEYELKPYTFYTDSAIRRANIKGYYTYFNDKVVSLNLNEIKARREYTWIFFRRGGKKILLYFNLQRRDSKNTQRALLINNKYTRKCALQYYLYLQRPLNKIYIEPESVGNREYNVASKLSNKIMNRINTMCGRAYFEYDCSAIAPLIFFAIGGVSVTKNMVYSGSENEENSDPSKCAHWAQNEGVVLSPVAPVDKGIEENSKHLQKVYINNKIKCNTILNKFAKYKNQRTDIKTRDLRKEMKDINWNDKMINFAIDIIKGKNIFNTNFLTDNRRAFFNIYTWIEKLIIKETKLLIKDIRASADFACYRKHDSLQFICDIKDERNLKVLIYQAIKDINAKSLLEDFDIIGCADYFPYKNIDNDYEIKKLKKEIENMPKEKQWYEEEQEHKSQYVNPCIVNNLTVRKWYE